MIPLFLVLATCLNTIASVDHQSTGLGTHIDIESPFTPNSNTSYGHIQILNEIAIQFNLIYHEQNHTYNQPNSIQNIFHLESTKSRNTNIIYCSYYPSMWLTPIDNSLYFSLLKDAYCLETLTPIIPNIPYSITIQYDTSSVYIAINDTILLNEAHNLPFNALNHNIDTLQLWISDSISDPASVTIYNMHIKTSITVLPTQATDPIDPTKAVVKHIHQTKYKKSNSDTVFVIEMAVLSVFAFACFGVIIASLCLYKLRQSSMNNRKKRHSVRLKPVTQRVSIDVRKAKPPKQSYKAVDINKIVSLSDEEYALPMPQYTNIDECKTEKDSFEDGISTVYYTESLDTTVAEADRMYKRNEQIPKYASSTNTASSGNTLNIHCVTPMTLTDIAESAELPQSPHSIDPEIIKDIYAEHQFDGDISFDGDCSSSLTEPIMDDAYDDAYDLNSDEGADIKLRRAVIQSQRAVVEAFNIPIEPFEAPDDDDDDDDAAIQSIYDTIHMHCIDRKPFSISSTNSGSIEELFNNTDNTTQNISIPEPGSLPTSSVLGVAGSGPYGSIGPSIPSLATEITSNRYSTITNTTYLTDATKRLMLPSEDAKTSSSMFNNCNSSSDDESTIITRKSNTLSALSLANTIHLLSENYEHLNHSDGSSTGNIHLSKSKSLSDNIFETEEKEDEVSTMIGDRIKMMRKKYSIDIKDSDSETNTVCYNETIKSLNSFNDMLSKTISIEPYSKIGILDDGSSETSDNDKEFEWIKFALKECDGIGWDKYFQNFRKHKVDESRLRKLADSDWKDLIPEIGPRNDFKELWRIRQIP